MLGHGNRHRHLQPRNGYPMICSRRLGLPVCRPRPSVKTGQLIVPAVVSDPSIQPNAEYTAILVTSNSCHFPSVPGCQATDQPCSTPSPPPWALVGRSSLGQRPLRSPAPTRRRRAPAASTPGNYLLQKSLLSACRNLPCESVRLSPAAGGNQILRPLPPPDVDCCSASACPRPPASATNWARTG